MDCSSRSTPPVLFCFASTKRVEGGKKGTICKPLQPRKKPAALGLLVVALLNNFASSGAIRKNDTGTLDRQRVREVRIRKLLSRCSEPKSYTRAHGHPGAGEGRKRRERTRQPMV